jgi:hypothetical protein
MQRSPRQVMKALQAVTPAKLLLSTALAKTRMLSKRSTEALQPLRNIE